MKLELNLTLLDPAQTEARLIEEFEALAPGESVILRSVGSPVPLLDLVQRHAPGGFDWHPLENRDQGWRIQLTRRRADASAQRQLVEFMSTDHRRLRRLSDAVVRAARDGDTVEVTRSYRHLTTGLLRHLDMEEQVVFPVLVEKLGHPGGPANLLLTQHGRLRDLVSSIGLDIQATPKLERLVPLLSELVDTLDHHQAVEDRVLYGLTDRVLNATERDALVRKCQQVESRGRGE